MPYKYIGRTNSFKGKPLWEIIGNLKNFGVGRIVARSKFERYPEPSYMKIVKVEAFPAPEKPSMDSVRRARVWVEAVFRGRKNPNIVHLELITYKSDFKLIPKDEEASYCQCDKTFPFEQKILPRTMPLPPLLKELIVREMELRGEEVTKDEHELQVPIQYNQGRESYYKVAEEGETPTTQLLMGLGTPVSPNLYKDVKFEQH